MTTSTKELIEQSTVLAGALRKVHLKVLAQALENAAQRMRELQEELDEYCPRPANGQTDHTSAGCIKRGECGCDIRGRLKSGGTPNE
jgi:hypothetical protein